MKKNFELINRNYDHVMIKELTSNYNYQYFELSSEINHDSLKIEEISYRLLRNENDNLANWQGRDQSTWYVSEASIIAAEKMLKSNLTKLKKDLKNGKLHPAYKLMEEYVGQIVNHYKADFFFHDTLRLANNDFSKKFIWIARECGTWLFYGRDTWSDTIIESLKKSNENHIFFFYNGSSLKEVSLEQASAFLYSECN